MKNWTIILIFFYSNVYTQNACLCDYGEKLKPKIYALADNGKFDSALLIYEKIKNQGSNVCSLLSLHGSAQLYIQKKNWNLAENTLKDAEKIMNKLNCKAAIFSKHFSITGLFFTRTNKLDSAAWAFMKAMEFAEKSDNKYALARSYGDVATAFSKIGDLQKSIEYDKKSIALSRILNNEEGKPLLAAKLVSLALIFEKIFENTGNIKYLDSIKYTAEEALLVAKEAKEIKRLLEAYNIIARYYYNSKNYTQSIAYSDSSIADHVNGFTNYTTYLAYHNKSQIALITEAYINAASLADSSEKYAALFSPEAEIKALKLVHEANKQLNNLLKSSMAFERMTLLKDSLYTLENNRVINELEKKYNQTKNEKTIKELSQQKQIYLLLGIIGLLSASTIAFFYRQATLKSKQKILETEQRLNRSRMNPHFFFNALTVLQRFAMKENDGKALANNISRFSNIMRQTLESSYKEYVTIKQEVEFLKEYTELQKLRYPAKFDYSIMIDGELEPSDILIPSMIIQPFIENSIEYGFDGNTEVGKITVLIHKQDSEILITIHDNGNGLNTHTHKHEEEHISRASQIVKDRIYLLNIKLKSKAKFSIDNNENEKGVIVKIYLPVIYNNENFNS